MSHLHFQFFLLVMMNGQEKMDFTEIIKYSIQVQFNRYWNDFELQLQHGMQSHPRFNELTNTLTFTKGNYLSVVFIVLVF